MAHRILATGHQSSHPCGGTEGLTTATKMSSQLVLEALFGALATVCECSSQGLCLFGSLWELLVYAALIIVIEKSKPIKDRQRVSKRFSAPVEEFQKVRERTGLMPRATGAVSRPERPVL